MIAVLVTGGPHHRRVGSCAAFGRRLGHEEGRSGAAFDQRFQKSLLDLRAADLAQQIDIALIGRGRVAGQRPQRRQAGLRQHDRGFPLAQVTAVVQDVWCQHARSTRLVLEFGDQRLAGTIMMVAARILFIGGDDIANEGFHLRCDHSGALRADAAHLGAIRIAPSRRMTSPFSMGLAMICSTISANSSGWPRRVGKGT